MLRKKEKEMCVGGCKILAVNYVFWLAGSQRNIW